MNIRFIAIMNRQPVLKLMHPVQLLGGQIDRCHACQPHHLTPLRRIILRNIFHAHPSEAHGLGESWIWTVTLHLLPQQVERLEKMALSGEQQSEMKRRDINQLTGARGTFLHPVPEMLSRVVVVARFILAQTQEAVRRRDSLAGRDELSKRLPCLSETILVVIDAPQPPPTSAPRRA